MQHIKSFRIFALTVLLALVTGCTMRTSHLTAISTKDFKPLAQPLNVVRGEDCASLLFGLIPMTSTFQPKIGRATSNALKQSNADILLDVKVSTTFLFIPLIITRVCEVVEGTAAQTSSGTP